VAIERDDGETIFPHTPAPPGCQPTMRRRSERCPMKSLIGHGGSARIALYLRRFEKGMQFCSEVVIGLFYFFNNRKAEMIV
jgi:hypothetical protein